jgi:hypothetical protein
VAELSVHFSEDAITFADGGELLGKLKKTSVDPRGLEGFVKVNYTMQGTVAYQTFLQGVVAGLSLAFGPAGEPRADLEEISPTVAEQILSGELTAADLELLPGEIVVPEPAKELQSISADEVGTVESVLAGTEVQHGGLTTSRSPENETIVPSAETPAAVGETIVPVSESPAAVSEETRGLTPPGSPATDAAGAVSP